jgi:preprotein translocase subunit SecE
LQELGITSQPQYSKYRKENNKINWPFWPNEFYNISRNELFGKTKISLEKLQEKLQELGITSQPQYLKYRKENNKINWPSHPDKFYNIKLNELFGKIKISLEQLQEKLQELGITSQPQYLKYRKENNKINWPSHPDKFYNISWSELFGKIKKEFLSLEELQKKLKEHNITTKSQYLKYRKENNKINWPSEPRSYNISWNYFFEKINL